MFFPLAYIRHGVNIANTNILGFVFQFKEIDMQKCSRYAQYIRIQHLHFVSNYINRKRISRKSPFVIHYILFYLQNPNCQQRNIQTLLTAQIIDTYMQLQQLINSKLKLFRPHPNPRRLKITHRSKNKKSENKMTATK